MATKRDTVLLITFYVLDVCFIYVFIAQPY